MSLVSELLQGLHYDGVRTGRDLDIEHDAVGEGRTALFRFRR